MDFSLRVAAQLILEEINKRDSSRSKNIVLSPTSITFILSLLAHHGSAGKTQRQFLNVLGHQTRRQQHLDSKSQEIISLLAPLEEDEAPEPEYYNTLPRHFFVSALPISDANGRASGLPPWTEHVPGNGLPFVEPSPLLSMRPGNGVPVTEPSPWPEPIVMRRIANGEPVTLVRAIQELCSMARGNGVPVGFVPSNNGNLVARVQPRQIPVFSMLNALWVDERYPLVPCFKQVSESVYNALAKNVDLMSLRAQRVIIDEVNSWGERETEGLVKDLLPKDAQLESPFSLVNALYFKAILDSNFAVKNTRYSNFHLLDGKTKKIPFMTKQNGHDWYATFEDFKVLQLMFNRLGHKKFSMFIFLPHARDGLRGLAEILGSDPASLSPDKFRLGLVDLAHMWIPKMNLSHEFRAERLFKDNGLSQAFDKRFADFSKMVDSHRVNAKGNVYLRMFLHKARIEVRKEEVAEEAAITSTVYDEFRSDCEPEPLPSFVADHPFLFTIVDDLSSNVIFAGAFINPVSK